MLQHSWHKCLQNILDNVLQCRRTFCQYNPQAGALQANQNWQHLIPMGYTQNRYHELETTVLVVSRPQISRPCGGHRAYR